MKRIIALLGAVIFALWLSPAAFAECIFARPGVAQHVYTEAEDFETYRGDFYMSALSSVSREGDDLRMEFDNSRIVLRGFFATRDERRSFIFKDGVRISAADFDENGKFTGELASGYTVKKSGGAEKTMDSAATRERVIVTKGRGTTVCQTEDGYALYGAKRTCADGVAEERIELGCNWDAVESMIFTMEVGEEGEMRLVRESATCKSGVIAYTTRPGTVHIADGTTLIPIERGRASVRFENSLGDELQTLNVRVNDDTGAPVLECACPECGKESGGALHMLPCGHYECTVDDADGHGVPECGIAGHCVTGDEAHSTCSNCLKPLCTGDGHGVGVCEHAHSWRQHSFTSPTATTPGQTVAKCATCGMTYTQVLPALGG